MGYNIAEAFGDVGAKAIIILDVLEKHGDEAVKAFSGKYGIPVRFKQVDVRQEESVQKAVDEVSYLLFYRFIPSY